MSIVRVTRYQVLVDSSVSRSVYHLFKMIYSSTIEWAVLIYLFENPYKRRMMLV